MQPFKVSEASKSFNKTYLSSEELKDSIHYLNNFEVIGLLHQWISEGIPFAFKANPLLFESVRLWLASNLNIEAKEITLIGSARLGFSLSPPPNFGKEFGKHSDLDFSIISSKLFDSCRNEFEIWKREYTEGTAFPKNERERNFWNNNKVEVAGTIKRGFIDSNKIPNRYPVINNMNNSLWRLQEKMGTTENAPEFTKASIRIYENWTAFRRQLQITFNYLIGKLKSSGVSFPKID